LMRLTFYLRLGGVVEPLGFAQKRTAGVTYFDFAEALQVRTCADLAAEKIAYTPRERRDRDERLRDELLKVHTAGLENVVGNAEALGEQRCQEAETAAKKIAQLERQIAGLQEAVAKAEALGEQQHQKAQTSAKQADHLVAELIEMTGEFVEMSKQIRDQTAAIDKLRAELDDYRPGS
jgi:chromosome segregation ATPase